jgi:hypothetical protein
LTCGFDRSNFAFAMMPFSRCPSGARVMRVEVCAR